MNKKIIEAILKQEQSIKVARDPNSYTVSQVNDAAKYLADRVDNLEKAIEQSLTIISDELFK